MFLFVEDQDVFLRMISLGMKMYNLQEILYSYRLKKNPLSKQDKETIFRNRYRLGNEYLKNYYKSFSENTYDYNFRYGLMEYYSGNINSASKYFWKAARLKSSNRGSIWRYLIPSLLGDSIIKFLRNNNILSKMSFFINRYGRDYHKIVKNG